MIRIEAAFLAWPGCAAILAALPGARAVGGAVRDALAGLAVHDVDIAAPLPPEAIAGRLRGIGAKVIETGLAHGTLTAVIAGLPYEVTALRRDIATDGRHAEVAWTTDWAEDAARRDFTINAMSLAADGTLFDYFGGQADLAAGRVRFVGEPERRIAEDCLRILRYFRFQARYGRGAPDQAALDAIRARVAGMARLSIERVWMELKRLLAGPRAAPSVALMRSLGVLAAVLPEAAPDEAALARMAPLSEDGLLRFAALLAEHTAIPALAARLKLSGAEAGALAAWQGSPPAGVDADLRRALAVADHPTLLGRCHLAEARDGLSRAALRARLEAMARPVFPIQGRDALALGARPGAALGAALGEVRAWWLARGCVDGAEACRARLSAILAGGGDEALGVEGDPASPPA